MAQSSHPCCFPRRPGGPFRHVRDHSMSRTCPYGPWASVHEFVDLCTHATQNHMNHSKNNSVGTRIPVSVPRRFGGPVFRIIEKRSLLILMGIAFSNSDSRCECYVWLKSTSMQFPVPQNPPDSKELHICSLPIDSTYRHHGFSDLTISSYCWTLQHIDYHADPSYIFWFPHQAEAE